MLHLCSAFINLERNPSPTVSCTFDDETNAITFYPMHHAETGKINVAFDNKIALEDALKGKRIMVVDSKAHHDYFRIESSSVWEAAPTVHVNGSKLSMPDTKKLLLRIVDSTRKVKPTDWRRLHAAAARVYTSMQRRKVICNGQLQDVWYKMDTVSGRSRAIGFPIQTVTEDVAPVTYGTKCFIHFDWLSADLRAAAVLSMDPDMMAMFDASDPYTELSKKLQIDRKECKKHMLSSIYSLNLDDEMLRCFPAFHVWMKKSVAKIRNGEAVRTILNRRMSNDNERTAFNASIQGTVAHAMQAVLIKVNRLRPGSIFTELQDSLVLTVADDDVDAVISDVSKAMLRPFHGLLSNDHTFPIKVSMGRKWRQWQRLGEIRKYL